MSYEPTEDEVQVLPCGCVVTTIVATKTLQYVPCRMDCPNFKDAVALAEEKGMPPTYRVGP